MWFDSELNIVWEKAIEPAIIKTGYEAKRIDKHPHNESIVDEILSLIRRSKFVVADLTSDNLGDRGGVYFEAGFAKGMRIDVIFTCRSDFLDKLHFDLKHFNFITWERNEYDFFQETLAWRIEQTLGRGNN